MRIGCDHSVSATATTTRNRATADAANGEFAKTLTSAVETSASDVDSRPPELSAATYRLFAAIDLERGDTEHAAGFLSRVPDAREAGLPLYRSGALSETGRWDYTPAAAALPETGRFDTASAQGHADFFPYNTGETPTAGDCTGEVTTADADARLVEAAAAGSDPVPGRFAEIAESARNARVGRRADDPDLAVLLETLRS